MTVYVIVEHDGRKIHPSFFNVLKASLKVSYDSVALILGSDCKKLSNEIASYKGISKVLIIEDESLQHPLAERFAPIIAKQVTEQDTLLVGATSFGKNLMPRVAALLATPQVSDVIEIIDHETFRHPIYAGNAIETVKFPPNHPVCLTIRPTAFHAEQPESQQAAPVEALEFCTENTQSEFVSLESHVTERPSLSCAKIVVSGGRGLQNAEGFKRVVQIADRLGAAIGATRAAVDSGLAPNDWQVGQTGQVVAPSLYFAVGISGAIQHLAGMKDSQVIVAINKDPDAPIFQIASYGLVADLNELLPEWEQTLTDMGY